MKNKKIIELGGTIDHDSSYVYFSFDKTVSTDNCKSITNLEALRIESKMMDLGFEGALIGGMFDVYDIDLNRLKFRFTYDVTFNDDTNSDACGFKQTYKYCKNHINAHNGTNHSYFEDYKGGFAAIYCHQLEENIYSEEIS